MTMSADLMVAILAMDAYNRGYDAGLPYDGNRIGDAIALTVPLPAGSKGYGFYAVAYSLNGQTVISYRGTDDPIPDILYGYGVGAGSPYEPQAKFAIQFYQQVLQQVGANADVVLTGHSLGGGLAGFVAELYGRSGKNWGHTPISAKAQPRSLDEPTPLSAKTANYGVKYA